jgi:hypothetical protein
MCCVDDTDVLEYLLLLYWCMWWSYIGVCGGDVLVCWNCGDVFNLVYVFVMLQYWFVL